MVVIRRFFCAGFIFVFVLAAAGLRPAVAQVKVTDIGTINGRSSIGFGVNHAGDVAGFSYFTGTVGSLNGLPSEVFLPHGVLYNGGVLHDLGAIEGNPDCSPLGCQSEAFGVNDSHWVVGWTDNGHLGTLPVLWLPAAVAGGKAGINVLPALSPFHGSQATAINNAGQIVGFSIPGGAGFRAILWQLGAGGPTLTDLGTLRSDNQGSALASGINDLGQVVGEAADENGMQQGFLYLPAPAYGLPAGMNNLTPSQTFGAGAMSVNNHGEVVGALASGVPFVWLPAPAYGLPSGFSALALPKNFLAFGPTGISDGGQIVGTAFVVTNPSTRAFKRTAGAWRNGRWILLNDLLPGNSPWDLFSAEAVTHVGKTTRITGSGLLSGVTDVTGQTPAGHGYVLDVTCTGDLTNDGVVDQTDLNIVLGQLGQSVPPGTGGDLNGDGVVNQQDLATLAAQIHHPCL